MSTTRSAAGPVYETNTRISPNGLVQCWDHRMLKKKKQLQTALASNVCTSLSLVTINNELDSTVWFSSNSLNAEFFFSILLWKGVILIVRLFFPGELSIVRRKPVGTADILDLCDKTRELRKNRFKSQGSEKYKEVNNNNRCLKKAKENWIGEQCSETEENMRKNNRKRA